MKLTSKGKKILATTAIVLAMMSSSLLVTGCMSEEEMYVAAQTIEINNQEYTVGDLYILTNKNNPQDTHICKSEVVGYYDSLNRYSVTMYYDVSSSEIIGIDSAESNIYFNEMMRKKYTEEELKRLSEQGLLPGKGYKIKPYYEAIIENNDPKLKPKVYNKRLIRK